MNVTTEPIGCIEFAKSITFRFVQPHQPFSAGWRRIGTWYRRFGGAFDFLNTRFPKHNKRRLPTNLGKIPRMSTAAIGEIINRGVAQMGTGEAFVNVGVWNGFTFLSGLTSNPTKICIGVDNFSQFGGPKTELLNRIAPLESPIHRFYDLDYSDYFSKLHQDPIGFYLYDGEHSYENQMNGLRAAEAFFAPNCLIMVDDTNDPEPRQATLDFIKSSSHQYSIEFDEKTCENQHPTWWNGVMLLKKQG